MKQKENFVAVVQVKHRMVIPLAIYQVLKLKPGDKVRGVIEKVQG